MTEVHRGYDFEKGHSPESEEQVFFREMRQILINKLGLEKTEEIVEEQGPLYWSEELATFALCVGHYPSELKLLIDSYTLREVGETDFILGPEESRREEIFSQEAMQILTNTLGPKRAHEKVKTLSPQYRSKAMATLAACLTECPDEFKTEYVDKHWLKRNWVRFFS